MAVPSVLVIHNEPVLPKDHPDAAQEYDVIEATDIVVKILGDAGFSVRRLGLSYEPRVLLDELRDRPPDVVFNMFEGLGTQTGTEISVVGLLEWLNLPFTGCGSLALGLGRDKIRSKRLLQGAGLPTPAFLFAEHLPAPNWPYRWPAIVKPALQDCSLGIEQESVVTNPADYEKRVAHTLERFGPPVLIEEFIFGREMHANVLEMPAGDDRPPELIALPLTELVFDKATAKGFWPIYSYEAKWNEQSEEFLISPLVTVVPIAAGLKARIDAVTTQAFRLLDLRDIGRLDIRLTDDGTPYVLEVNPNPYLHSEAIFDGLKAIGRSHEQFIAGMVWNAWARRSRRRG